MGSGMNLEQAKEYAKTMTYSQAVSNIKRSKGIKYRKATMIKLRELAEIADRLDRKTEPTISKMEQVDKLQTKDYCDICNHKGCEYCISDSRNPYCIPSNYEPRTEGNE